MVSLLHALESRTSWEHSTSYGSDLNVTLHLNQSIPAGVSKMDCQEIAAAYLVERESGKP